ncbi:MAG: hypothetical protein SNJ70_11680 [Armatimonadota bacterium]
MESKYIEKEAKLFEAGKYDDKGIEITENDLDIIIGNSSLVPLKIEHIDTAFDGAIGFIQKLYRKGKELFANICFTNEAWNLIKSADAKRLSVSILPDKTAIKEVSLVKDPRIADASVFSKEEKESTINLSADCIDFSGEINNYTHNIFSNNADLLIEKYKKDGKLTPASENIAKALLSQSNSNLIQFGNENIPISHLFSMFMESQPKVIEYCETAAGNANTQTLPKLYEKLGITKEMLDKYSNL